MPTHVIGLICYPRNICIVSRTFYALLTAYLQREDYVIPKQVMPSVHFNCLTGTLGIEISERKEQLDWAAGLPWIWIEMMEDRLERCSLGTLKNAQWFGKDNKILMGWHGKHQRNRKAYIFKGRKKAKEVPTIVSSWKSRALLQIHPPVKSGCLKCSLRSSDPHNALQKISK